jgi:hypothetical protein
MQEIPRPHLAAQTAKNSSAGTKHNTGSRSERFCLLVQTILRVIRRNCAVGCTIFLAPAGYRRGASLNRHRLTCCGEHSIRTEAGILTPALTQPLSTRHNPRMPHPFCALCKKGGKARNQPSHSQPGTTPGCHILFAFFAKRVGKARTPIPLENTDTRNVSVLNAGSAGSP